MPETLIADLTHYLDDDGSLAEMPEPAARLAVHLCALVEAVTGRLPADPNHVTNVVCRRRPKHKPCDGEIIAFIQEDDPTVICWTCPFCGDNGYIRGWENSRWDVRRRHP